MTSMPVDDIEEPIVVSESVVRVGEGYVVARAEAPRGQVWLGYSADPAEVPWGDGAMTPNAARSLAGALVVLRQAGPAQIDELVQSLLAQADAAEAVTP